MSNIKKIKATKRTINIDGRKYFLEFPEILELSERYAIHLNGRYYFLPLPNIDTNNLICHGDSSSQYFWTSEFTGNVWFGHYINYSYWEANGFKAIQNKLTEMPAHMSERFITDVTFDDVKRSVRLFTRIPANEQTEEMQIYVIKHDPAFGVKHIANPCDEVIKYIVKNYPKFIKNFKPPIIGKIKEQYGLKVMLHLL